jgi:aldehyde dehydrogenase (NAD+)
MRPVQPEWRNDVPDSGALPNRDLPLPRIWVGDVGLDKGGGGVFDHISPMNGGSDGLIPLAGKAEIDAAVEAAAKGFEVWRAWKPEARRDAMLRLAALIDEHTAEFAVRAAVDNGTPVSFGGGAATSSSWFRYYAGWCEKIGGNVINTFGQSSDFTLTLREPIGVIGIIITWNGPMISIGMKVAPALAAGCSVVVKPSEMTPFAPDLFQQLVLEAGIPPGVVNVVPGAIEAGEALVTHPKVAKVSFTGGPRAAKRIMELCAAQLKPSMHELGGKSANLIFPDADMARATVYSATFPLAVLSGQGCALPTRVLVHQDVYAKVRDACVEAAKTIPVGDPFDPNIRSGPVVNRAAFERILGSIDKASSEGAGKLVCGGAPMGGELKEGCYIQPTVFADVDPKSDLAQHEVFGPVISLIPFKDEDEAVAIANGTDYGLAAFAQTHDLQRALRLSERLIAGIVCVNGGATLSPTFPFGGIGISGFGREGGREGLDEFLRSKTVSIANVGR